MADSIFALGDLAAMDADAAHDAMRDDFYDLADDMAADDWLDA